MIGHTQSNARQKLNDKRLDQEISLIKTLVMIVIVYIVFWLPLLIVYIFFPTYENPNLAKVRLCLLFSYVILNVAILIVIICLYCYFK